MMGESGILICLIRLIHDIFYIHDIRSCESQGQFDLMRDLTDSLCKLVICYANLQSKSDESGQILQIYEYTNIDLPDRANRMKKKYIFIIFTLFALQIDD